MLMANAVPPVTVPGDALPVGQRCPADGREQGVLIFYELDKCTDTLRVTKSRAQAGAVIVTW